MAESSEKGDVRPIPDPTALTTEASVRMDAALRSHISTEIRHQNELFNEKINVVINSLNMIDARTAEQKSDMKAALDAALAAQKEAAASQTASLKESITKTETATIERIKAVETRLSDSSRASDDKIDDLKSRIVAIEAVKLGNTEGQAAVRQGATSTQAIIAVVISVAFLLIAVVSVAIAILKP